MCFYPETPRLPRMIDPETHKKTLQKEKERMRTAHPLNDLERNILILDKVINCPDWNLGILSGILTLQNIHLRALNLPNLRHAVLKPPFQSCYGRYSLHMHTVALRKLHSRHHLRQTCQCGCGHRYILPRYPWVWREDEG